MDKERKSNRFGLPTISVIGCYRDYPGGQTPNEVYLHRAFERLGVPTAKIDRTAPGWPSRVPAKGVAIFAGPHCTKVFADAVRSRFNKVIFWTLDVPDAFGRLRMFQECARASDTVFASADWRDMGILGSNKKLPFVRIPAAVPGEPIAFEPKPELAATFLGTCYSGRRRIIANNIKAIGGRPITEPHEKVFGQRLARFVQSAKIVVGDNWSNEHPGYWSSRNYIIPGSGGFLLTAHVPGIENEFVVGRHLVTWKNLGDLKDKIRYYLRHDDERERIRREGYEFTQSFHRWECRALEMIAAIRRIL